MRETTIPEIVLPHNIPTMGTTAEMNIGVLTSSPEVEWYLLYCEGVQKGSTPMAKRMPMIDTGMVDPSIPNRTDENYDRRLHIEPGNAMLIRTCTYHVIIPLL